MDEFLVGMLTFAIFMVGLIGSCTYDSQATKQKQLECIRLVHEKPAVEVNAICGKAIHE